MKKSHRLWCNCPECLRWHRPTPDWQVEALEYVFDPPLEASHLEALARHRQEFNDAIEAQTRPTANEVMRVWNEMRRHFTEDAARALGAPNEELTLTPEDARLLRALKIDPWK